MQLFRRDGLVIPHVNIKMTVIGRNDIIRGQANRTNVPPDHKIIKAEDLTYLYINIV
jgi:hypothetical protein